MSSTDQQMNKARVLIEQKRYDEARSLLITIDDPKAEMWLNRINQMGSTPISRDSDKSFTVKLFVSIVLLLFLVVPGVISLAIFAPEAKQYPDAPGAKGLIFLNRISFVFLILAGLAVPLYLAFRIATFH